LALSSLGLAVGIRSAGAAPAAERRPTTARPKAPTRDALLKGFDPRDHRTEEGRYVSPLAQDHRAVLTLEPGFNEFVAGVLRRYQVPQAGFVAVEPSTGKLLAYVSHAHDAADSRDHAREASPPAASVFKLITGAALLERGVAPGASTCYHGGASRLSAGELTDNPKLDSACISLTGALGFSVNAVFGKLALKHLDAARLTRYASAFGFGESLPFDVATDTSALDVPRESVEFARTAAGFWHTYMSPLHAAMIASTVANRGRMMRPYVVDKILDPKGNLLSRTEPELHRSVIERKTAEQLGRMMRSTVAQGTARKFFFDGHGVPFLPGIEVAGKTGTLSKERPYRGYSWFVGFAPAEAPKVAIAALLVNSPKWRIKASYLAREALRYYLIDAPKKTAAAQVATR
jgi:cell division protein FtsI/penicillin-binding protein 2